MLITRNYDKWQHWEDRKKYNKKLQQKKYSVQENIR